MKKPCPLIRGLVPACLPLLVAACFGDPQPKPHLSSSAAGGEKKTTNDETIEATMTNQPGDPTASSSEKGPTDAPATEVATFGAGCFWCVEAVLEQIEGVTDVTSGYMGGEKPNPTYEDICTGTTGHAEVVQVTFDPAKISYEELLEHFWELHDPTTLNRQGPDRGTQYRSAIFYHSEAQRRAAEKAKKAKDASGAFADPIVTEITEAGPYYGAEGYHQDYYRLNKRQPYCRYVIAPKLNKLGLEQ